MASTIAEIEGYISKLEEQAGPKKYLTKIDLHMSDATAALNDLEDKRERPDTIRFLEVTTTLKTYEDSLRMEVLSKEGTVAAYGPVVAEGPRYRRISIKAPGIAREHQAIRADHLKLVQEAVERKAKKKYEPNTVLIVAIDDSVPFREKDDVAALDALATGTLVPVLRGTNFGLLALEGSNGLHLCYPIA